MAAPKVTSKRTVSDSALLRRLTSLEEECASARYSADRANRAATEALNLMHEIKAQHDLMLRVYNELSRIAGHIRTEKTLSFLFEQARKEAAPVSGASVTST